MHCPACTIHSLETAGCTVTHSQIGRQHNAMHHNDNEDERPEKRQRVESQPAVEEDGEGPAPPPPSQQITQALSKIANHIGNSNKFSKASQLLRQLMDAIDKSHRNELFHAIRCAFSNPDNCMDPLLRKDYIRLLKAVDIRSEVLSKQQRAQLEVYNTWGLLRNELFTDDSFVYNKVLGKIKIGISELSDADDEQEAAYAVLHGLSSGSDKQQQQQQVKQKAEGKPSAAAAAADEEADPFGLNEFLDREEAAAAAARESEAAAATDDPAAAGDGSSSREPKSQSSTWDPVTIGVMKKQALLDCIIAAKNHQHKLAWARTSIEMLIEEVAKPAVQGGFADKFVGGQKQQLQDLLKFVHAERAARKSGVNRRPGGKGTGEYMTSFERARAEWGSASWISIRGKVGAGGDAKANNWLG